MALTACTKKTHCTRPFMLHSRQERLSTITHSPQIQITITALFKKNKLFFISQNVKVLARKWTDAVTA